MATKRPKLPPRSNCGSIEKNKILRAINANQPNPCTENEECIYYYNKVKEQKNKEPEAYFSLLEPDDYEDALMDSMI